MSLPISLILGTHAWGSPEVAAARITKSEVAQELFNVFLRVGDTIDSSQIYTEGTSEKMISKLDLKGGRVDTKVLPLEPGAFAGDKLRNLIETSARSLAPHKINVLFLHAPDRSVPFRETAEVINELHKAGLFKEFGLSNFHSFEVAEFYFLAQQNGWILPTVYQGIYNALERQVETELLPCLRKYNIRFYVYSPMASGMLAGKDLKVAQTDGSRFDETAWPALAKAWIVRYSPFIPAIQELEVLAAAHKITLPQIAYRWLQYHSKLQTGDAVLIGATSLQQLEENLKAHDGGPLPDEIVTSLESIWQKTKGIVAHYAF